MKKHHSRKAAAILSGAAALMTLTPGIHAQSSVDALLNKLEQKGILSPDEAKQLKIENADDSTKDFNAALNSKFPMPDWVTSYKLSGDFRGRVDDIQLDNPSVTDRLRFRYRVRLGLTVDMKDNLQVGFRVGSGEPASGTGFGGNPLSNNSTLQDDGTKKFLYIDAAYGRWTPIKDGNWFLSTTIGKMDNPFALTPMVFDPDLTPEGAALQSSYKINGWNSIALNGAAFVLDELKSSSHDPFLYGAQLMWNANWSDKLSSSLGFSYFEIINKESLSATSASSNNGVPYQNQGNTRDASGLLLENFHPLIGDASVTYMLAKFPLYKGAFPIKFQAEFMNNPGAENKNNGFWIGGTLGKSGKKGTWDLSYRYEYLEANAWYDQLVDDDNGASYFGAPTAGSAGFFGGTNIKGHQVKLNYSITDALTFTFTCYADALINQVPAGSKSDAIHTMVDLMWKF